MQHLHFVGEQAEAFDQQREADRDWFETHRGVLYFRPQIPGEGGEQLALGITVPTVGPIGRDGVLDFLPDQAVGTAVVDPGRLWRLVVERRPAGPPTRMRVVPPLTHAARRDAAAAVLSFALRSLQALKAQGQQQRRFCIKSKGF